MSKAQRTRKVERQSTAKSRIRLAVVLVGLAALIGGAALLFSPQQIPFVSEVTGAPRVAVAQEVVDFGDVPVNKPVRAVFKVRNIGDQTLHILDKEPLLTVVEGCCPPRTALSSTVIQPGTEAILSVQFTMHPGMDGPHDFRVYLRTNDPLEPEKELQILSNWIS